MMRIVHAEKIRVCFNREDFRAIVWGSLLESKDLGVLVFNLSLIIFASGGGGGLGECRSTVIMCSWSVRRCHVF